MPRKAYWGGVDVQIHHAGDDEPIAAVRQRKRCILRGQLGKYALGFAAKADNIGVGLGDQLGFTFAVAHMALQDKIFQI